MAFVLSLFVPYLFLFWYLGQAGLHDCGLPWISSFIFEPAHDKTYKKACAPSEDSDQPGPGLSGCPG